MKRESRKVAIVVNTAWNIINFRQSLIKALQAAGHEVLVVAPADKYVQKIEALGCRFIPLTTLERKGTNPVKDLKLVGELTRIYKKEMIDVALHFTIKPNIYGSFAAARAGIKSISTVTGLGYSFISKGWVSRIAKGLYKRAFRRTSLVAFQNQDDQQLFIDKKLVKKEKSILIKGSGIDTDYFAPLKKSKVAENFIFLFVGRLLFDKGIRELLNAAKIVRKVEPNVEFWMVGALDEGNPSCVSNDLIEEFEQKGIIKYFGVSDQVREIMRNADAVILPSYREGLPRVMLEALSMAKPVITTDVPGCREVVKDGVNGYLVPAREVGPLAGAMQDMLRLSKEQRAQMGAHGRQLALEQFDQKIVNAKYEELIQQLG